MTIQERSCPAYLTFDIIEFSCELDVTEPHQIHMMTQKKHEDNAQGVFFDYTIAWRETSS